MENLPNLRTEETFGNTFEEFVRCAVEAGAKSGLVAAGCQEIQAVHNTITTFGANGVLEVGVVIGVHLQHCPPEVLRLVRELKAAIDKG